MLCIASDRVSYKTFLACYFIKWHSGGRLRGSRRRARAMCAHRCPTKVTELEFGCSLI